MDKKNKVFIATSLDGYIADKNGSIEWLNSIPNPDNLDMGYSDFVAQIDAIVMGRTTFETVCSFGIDWPYTKPVFILSNTLTELPKQYEGKAFLINGTLTDILEQIHKKEYGQLYIDGGVTIQNFLKEDLIDSITITTIPLLLGGGSSLFGEHQNILEFECTETKQFSNNIVQNTFLRKR
ncbi:dihydrofolate reductase [Prolixibacteraceae bacterium JC049]|nr:dihydrofolate reductase [Prolixibacteraceae bacterium JC049]